MRTSSRIAEARYESCGKQHCCRMPCSIILRIWAGAAENSDHTCVMAWRSASGRLSMLYKMRQHGESKVRKRKNKTRKKKPKSFDDDDGDDLRSAAGPWWARRPGGDT